MPRLNLSALVTYIIFRRKHVHINFIIHLPCETSPVVCIWHIINHVTLRFRQYTALVPIDGYDRAISRETGDEYDQPIIAPKVGSPSHGVNYIAYVFPLRLCVGF